MPSVLTSDQVDDFITTGATVLRHAFPAPIAERCIQRLWQESGLRPQAPEAWQQPVVHLQRTFADGPFSEIMNPRLSGAFDDLLGAGRYPPLDQYGWWPIAFPGFDRPPWQAPRVGWHVDGQHFHHHLNCTHQGLLPLFIFSDIHPGDGGTAYRPGSHVTTARVLQEGEPAGLDPRAITTLAATASAHLPGIEATGMPGDVLLLHPFMVHARSPNTGSRVRFICNPCIGMHAPLNLAPVPGSPAMIAATRTPLERSIMQAIGLFN